MKLDIVRYQYTQAMAADACRAHIPPGAECYICLNQQYGQQLRGDLVRMCSCRGPHAGFIHVRCLVAMAESRGENGDDLACLETLITCGQCRQPFRGPVAVALKHAAWLRCAGRAETDFQRQQALFSLGAALADVNRLDEALLVDEEVLATMRRLYGPDDWRTIEASEGVAITRRRLGGEENLQKALQTLTRVYAWGIQEYGRHHEDTLYTAAHLADTQHTLGMLTESIALRRRVLAGFRRVHGETHWQTLECEAILAQTLVQMNEVDEARAIRDRLLPVATRVLGPDHRVAGILRKLKIP